MNIIILVSLFISQGIASPSLKERLYSHACAQGVVSAQSVLPSIDQADEYYKRGMSSCAGSLVRMARTNELSTVKSVPEFACGYAVGAMFAKYGFAEELKSTPLSARATKAINNCLKKTRDTTK